jgi:hypothetical protein
MRSKKLLIGLLGFLVVVSFVAYKLQAQSRNTGLSVHPSNFDLNLTAGQPLEQVIALENLTDKTITVKVSTRNFTAQGEEGSVALTDEDNTYALAKWIKVTPDTVTLEPKKSQTFTFTITPPANAEPGGHFGSLVFATVPNAKLNTTGATLSQEVAALILARIPGKVHEQALVESFAADKSFYEFGPVSFTARVKNEGGVHIKPAGEVVITDMFGKQYDAPFETLNILPGATRKLPAILSSKLLIGKYTAHLVMAYGDTNQQLVGSTTFYAFPVRYAAVLLIVLVLLFLMRRRLGKAFKAIVSGK